MIAPAAAAPPFAVGALVQDDTGQERIVVGYKPDGRCMTVGAPDLPWVREGAHAIEVRPPSVYRLTPRRARAAAQARRQAP
ncbi:MAG: hypothetical protein AB7N76_03295 [Planctomycetota bacterium]